MQKSLQARPPRSPAAAGDHSRYPHRSRASANMHRFRNTQIPRLKIHNSLVFDREFSILTHIIQRDSLIARAPFITKSSLFYYKIIIVLLQNHHCFIIKSSLFYYKIII